jgi:sugar diacid utilization regulator
MPRLADLLDAPALRALVVPLTQASGQRDIKAVTLIEDIDELGDVPANAIAILGRDASAEAPSYRFDMGLRLAADRSVSALVLTGAPVGELTPSANAIAERSGIAILFAGPECELGSLVIAIHREITGEADAALDRASNALRAVRWAEARHASPDELIEAASEALGVKLRISDREPQEDELYAAIGIADGTTQSRLVAPRADHAGTEASIALVLEITAAAASRSFAEQRRAEELPALSRAELLGELLQSPRGHEAELRDRARSGGLPIDGWHTVVHIEYENLRQIAGEEEASAFELAQSLRRLALQSVRATGGVWHEAHMGNALILIRMDRADPGPRAGAAVTSSAGQAIQRLRTRVPELAVYCGVGSGHAGSDGLLASAAEARVALAAARTTNRANTPVGFDTVGLRRMLIEWYSLDTAREAVRTLLAPLDQMGRKKSEVAIRTLAAYLDNQGSLSRAAKALHLHRNSVAYRIERIFELLEIDPEDPDERLLLQLACRARSLG